MFYLVQHVADRFGLHVLGTLGRPRRPRANRLRSLVPRVFIRGFMHAAIHASIASLLELFLQDLLLRVQLLLDCVGVLARPRLEGGEVLGDDRALLFPLFLDFRVEREFGESLASQHF